MKMKHSLDTFLALYNLRLRPKQQQVETDTLALSRRELLKLRQFLERYTTRVFCLKNEREFERFVSAKKECNHVFEIWGTVGFYEYKNNVDWFHSKDLAQLLIDYRRMEEIIENFLQTQTISKTNLSWVNELAKFQAPLLIAVDQDGTPFDGDTIDLKTHCIIESSGYRLEWHGIAISEIALAIYESISHLLREDLTIKVCTLSDCDKIYVPSGRGRGSERIYCSVSCRVRAYKKRVIYD